MLEHLEYQAWYQKVCDLGIANPSQLNDSDFVKLVVGYMISEAIADGFSELLAGLDNIRSEIKAATII